MTMVFETVQTEGISQLSYLVGDDSSGTAAMIDPRPNVDIYLRMARDKGVTITHIFETHIHADFMSGALELASRLGQATICVSGERGAKYGFDAKLIHGDDSFVFGSVLLTARHTPGHTPEHMAFELSDESESTSGPWGVLTGDALFVGSAGRPDLLGDEQTESLSEDLFRTLNEYFLSLGDHVVVFPCHGAGSACGASIGDRPLSTIGFERQTNPFLQHQELEQFKQFVNKDAPPVPQHYPILKKVNAAGPSLIGASPIACGLPPREFHKRMQDSSVQLVDTRQMLAFGGGHIPGAINIGARPELSVWAGDMLSYDQPILLIVEDEERLTDILWLFANVGLMDFAGYLVGGMKAWENSGLPLQPLPQIPVLALKDRMDEFQLLDVRSESEFEQGRIGKADHYYVGELRDGVNGQLQLDRRQPLAVYCGSGYRASIAASLLQRAGFELVHNVPGSMQAWKSAELPTEK